MPGVSITEDASDGYSEVNSMLTKRPKTPASKEKTPQ